MARHPETSRIRIEATNQRNFKRFANKLVNMGYVVWDDFTSKLDPGDVDAIVEAAWEHDGITLYRVNRVPGGGTGGWNEKETCLLDGRDD